jgi:hypothetical protein
VLHQSASINELIKRIKRLNLEQKQCRKKVVPPSINKADETKKLVELLMTSLNEQNLSPTEKVITRGVSQKSKLKTTVAK